MTPEIKELLARELHHFDRFLLHLKFLIRDAPELAQKELFAHLLEEETEHFAAFRELCEAGGIDTAAALKPPKSLEDIVAEIPAGARAPWDTQLRPARVATALAPAPGPTSPPAPVAASPTSDPAQVGPGSAHQHHRARDVRRFTVGSLITRR